MIAPPENKTKKGEKGDTLRQGVPRANPELYQKYRPARLEQLIGAEALVKYFRGKLADPAYDRDSFLFVGPSGSGKTTAARIVAAMFGENAFFDRIELDAAAFSGIDDVRRLREDLPYAPAGGKWKVYTVDEAHNLSEKAKEGFLRIVEDLPARRAFIFTSDRPGIFKESLWSRLKVFTFGRVPDEKMLAHLKSIMKSEGWKLPGSVLDMVIWRAGGNVRAALQELQKAHDIGAEEYRAQLTLEADLAAGSAEGGHLGARCPPKIPRERLLDRVSAVLEGLFLLEPEDQENARPNPEAYGWKWPDEETRELVVSAVQMAEQQRLEDSVNYLDDLAAQLRGARWSAADFREFLHLWWMQQARPLLEEWEVSVEATTRALGYSFAGLVEKLSTGDPYNGKLWRRMIDWAEVFERNIEGLVATVRSGEKKYAPAVKEAFLARRERRERAREEAPAAAGFAKGRRRYHVLAERVVDVVRGGRDVVDDARAFWKGAKKLVAGK